jgi:hypothetical protein
MQLSGFANVNLMASSGQLLSYSETFTGRPNRQAWEKSSNSRQAIEKQAIIPRPECSKMGIIWAILNCASLHDIWCKRGTKVIANLRIISTGN